VRGRVEMLEPSAWRRVLDVNLTGAFLLARRSCRGCGRGARRILAVASISAHVGTAEDRLQRLEVGLIGFAKSLAEEVRAPVSR